MSEMILPTTESAAERLSRQTVTTSFNFFCLYRGVIALAIFLSLIFFPELFQLQSGPREQFARYVAGEYFACLLMAFWLLSRGGYSPRTQLSAQVILDIFNTVLLVSTGGVFRHGLAVILLLSLLGASLVEREGRMSLFYAAVATTALLLEQALATASGNSDYTSLFLLGIICVGFFGSAIAGRMMANRVLSSERLAKTRGDELERQRRINSQIIQDMGEGVLVISPEGLVRQYNPRGEELLGHSCANQIPLQQACPPLWLSWQQARLDSGKLQQSLRAPDSSLLLQVRWVPTPPDDIQGDWLLFLEDHDIFFTRSQQEKLASMGQLTMNLAHEIRNPLSSIRHAVDLLEETTKEMTNAHTHTVVYSTYSGAERRATNLSLAQAPTQQRLAQIVRENSDRLERLMSDVLDAGRLESVQGEKIPLADFFSTFFRDLALSNCNYSLYLKLSGDENTWIHFDKDHLHRILNNLLSNALRYASRSADSININIVPQEDFKIAIHVRDNGEGIALDSQSRLFEPLYTTAHQGTGLGLYICRQLCLANHAEILFMGNDPGAHFKIIGHGGVAANQPPVQS